MKGSEEDPHKAELQESLYEFPYHYIPYFDSDGIPHRIRILTWGMEYLCYQKHIKELVEAHNPESILDIGCGDGFFLGTLSKIDGKKIGIDLSQNAIAFAKAFHPSIDYRCMSVENVEEVFDIATCIEVLEHIPDQDLIRFIQSTFSKIRRNGRLILSVPSVVIPTSKKHYRHYNLELILKTLESAEVRFLTESVEYVYYAPRWMKFINLLTYNKFGIFEPHLLRKFFWKRIWNKYRRADEETGHHIILCIKKL